ncbi:MAG TPA: folate family ECF transporter S component, partial [Candidatus Atribacteria bacterium]|nr:folate family ECF transporter S component [Candidatus Atribacteria bacterium]
WEVLLPPRMVAEPIQIFIYAYVTKIILKRNILVIKSQKI